MTEDLSSTFGEPATSQLRGLLPPRRDPADDPAVGEPADAPPEVAPVPVHERRPARTNGTDATNRRWGVARVTAREHVDLLVLCALRAGPASGRDVVERLHADSDGALAAPERTVHATLHRLARNRLLRRTGAGAGTGPHYALTDTGRRVLRARVRAWQTLARAVDQVVESEPTP